MTDVILIDGKNSLYRYGHAQPELHHNGFSTGAIYGMCKGLLRLKKAYPDAQFVYVWDGHDSRRGWRNKLYPGYKQKELSDAELTKNILLQEDPIRTLIEMIGIPQLCVPKLEADDVIGVLACHLKKAYRDVYIYSSDKDFLQLIEHDIRVIRDVKKDGLKYATDETVFELFGCTVSELTKLRAFVGDKSDRIPGVRKGLGPVTAVKLIRAGIDPSVYGSGIEFGEQLHINYRLSYVPRTYDHNEFDVEIQNEIVDGLDSVCAALQYIRSDEEDIAQYQLYVRHLGKYGMSEDRLELWRVQEI